MKVKNILILTAAVFITATVWALPRKQQINDNWQFRLGDLPEVPFSEKDCEGWRTLRLPHDWSIEARFDSIAPAGNDGGYLPTGIGWYTKSLHIMPEMKNKKLQLYFEGVYMNSDVYVNGKHAGGHSYGYTSFFVDITPYVHEGENTVAVRVDNSLQKNCRWYTGSGIYRNVWLLATELVHIDNWGVAISTPDLKTAKVLTALSNGTDKDKTITVTAEIGGQIQKRTVVLAPNTKSTKVEHVFAIPDAKPWSPQTPNLYEAKITVTYDNSIIDEVTEKFGFRTIDYSSEEGFKLNGEKILINGGCVHHDNGILGTAAYDDAERHRVKQLKEAGFNAVRTSHNIPSEAFLDACDEIGLMVIDEAFDGWRDAKNTHDYSTLFDKNWQDDASAMVLRDRNHPSIICWSVGNEVIERKHISIITTARNLVSLCREIDPTRPVTSALCAWDSDWEIYDPHAEVYDIVGYNYMIHKSEGDHERVPSRIIWQTESYPKDAWSNYRKVADNPYIIGDFVWTAMDYIGESGIGRYHYEGDVPGEHWERPLFPWHASYCGDIDLTGLRKPISHYRSMLWNKDGEHFYLAVREPDGYNGKIVTTLWGTWPTFESWNWPGHEGKNIDVEVYSHYPTVRLFLNNKLIGEKEPAEMKATFTLPYKEGTLCAEGIKDGRVKESRTLSTAGKVSSICLTSKEEGELVYIIIELVDKNGNVVPIANHTLTVSVKGSANLLALGNADIKDCDPYFDNTHKAWKGRALAVARGIGKPGVGTITVSTLNENGKKISKSAKFKIK